jgi:hypothetical protein
MTGIVGGDVGFAETLPSTNPPKLPKQSKSTAATISNNIGRGRFGISGGGDWTSGAGD